jgi:hypothetical protein
MARSSTPALPPAIAAALAAIPVTPMRGTDNAALASVLGALNNAAAADAVTDTDTAMAYLKQAITLLLAIPTTAMRGTDSAALASVLGSLADGAVTGAVTADRTAMMYLKQLVTSILLIPTTAMRGTDSAALASVVGGLADTAAAGDVTEADTIMAYVKQLVTAIQLIPVTAMRGTDSAALASVVGALADAAADGAVTDTDTAMAYLKQAVTLLLAVPTTAMRGTDSAFLAAVGGALADAAATGAVSEAKTVMAYVKQLVTAAIVSPSDISAVGLTKIARSRPYPYDTGAVFSCTSHATEVNTFPVAYTSLIPEGTFDFGDTPEQLAIDQVFIESMDTNAVYVLELYRSPVGDASYTPIGAVRFSRTSVQVRSYAIDLRGRPVNAATEHVWARLKSTPANAVVTFSLSVRRHISTSLEIAGTTGVWPLG